MMHFSLVQNFRTVNCIIFFGKTKTQSVVELYPDDVSNCLSNKLTWTRKNLTPSFLGNLNVFSKKRALKPTVLAGHKTSQKCIMIMSMAQLHISNPCCDGPFSHATITPKKTQQKSLLPDGGAAGFS